MRSPAVQMFVFLLWCTCSLGARLHRAGPNGFTRTIGMSTAALASGVLLINVVGSRRVDLCVAAYLGVTPAVVA